MIRVDVFDTSAATVSDLTRAQLSPLEAAHASLLAHEGPGAFYTDWIEWPRTLDREELARIHKAAEAIRAQSDALVVIGIGGSYLGARAVLDALLSPQYNLKKKDTPDIHFAGQSVSPGALADTLTLLEGKDVSVNVISKSGTTTEPAVAFRIFKGLLEKKYGKTDAARRIFATTDKDKGALRRLCDAEGYESFVIPDGIGGRYSVFTPVGLLPLAVAGVDIDALLSGAHKAMEDLAVPGADNPAWQYAAVRNHYHKNGKTVEVLGFYEPSLRFVGEWWKQLFGESEGKDGCGLFPASVEYTADLHSMGQYMQDGPRMLLETILRFKDTPKTPVIPEDPGNADGLDFLAGLPLSELGHRAFLGTMLAHVDGGVPNLVLTADRLDAFGLGYTLYFFMFSCALSGRLLGVNPFDQPGVEDYKRNMFALLGKPGFEAETKTLTQRVDSLGSL